MNAVDFLIPMAGLSRRFAEAGFPLPKYMLEAAGRTLFEHSVGSLPLELPGKAVFVALEAHEREHGVAEFIGGRMEKLAPGKKWELALLPAPTRGQAETCLAAAGLLTRGAGLAIFNIDTGFRSRRLSGLLADPAARLDGVIGCFRLDEPDPKWSFAETGPDGTVARTAEKEQISPYALTGLYHFSRAEDFLSVARRQVAAGAMSRGEFYVAPMYNELIAAGRRFVLDPVDELLPLGTPEDLRRLEGKP